MLPVIIFSSAVFALLFYCGVMQKMIQMLAWPMQHTMAVSAVEAFSAAANVFLGMVRSECFFRWWPAAQAWAGLMQEHFPGSIIWRLRSVSSRNNVKLQNNFYLKVYIITGCSACEGIPKSLRLGVWSNSNLGNSGVYVFSGAI